MHDPTVFWATAEIGGHENKTDVTLTPTVNTAGHQELEQPTQPTDKRLYIG